MKAATDLKELATPKSENKSALPLGVDMKKVNARNKKYYDEEKEIGRSDRKVIEITKETRFYSKGQVIRPSIAFGDELIAQKTGKEVKLEKGQYVSNGKIISPKPKVKKV
jgi:hypothetical protein